MKQSISIRSIVSTSPLGSSSNEVWDQYQNNEHRIEKVELDGCNTLGAKLPSNILQQLRQLTETTSKYRHLDKSVLLAIYTARNAVRAAKWADYPELGINIGSSRGATSLFERFHKDYISKGSTPTLTSPTTTLGNISSWVAHDLQTDGPDISHSITCSTSLHALLNAMAWIRSGMATKFLVGGSETPLTPFTVAQMKALKIYAKDSPGSSKNDFIYPCRALDLNKHSNSMVLGEAASMACLEPGISEESLAIIEGVGFATEPLEHNVSLSADAICLQRSMTMALGDVRPHDVDVVVMHAPGTLKGDLSEYRAVEKIFGGSLPALTGNKWKIGHCFGASGMLSIELAVNMLRFQKFIGVPYLKDERTPDKLDRILVNAVGFGGNAVSILLKRVGDL